MSEEKETGKAGGLLFVACMFIGGGIGLALDHVAVGGAIGMGIGFILMAFVKTKEEPVEVTIPSSASAYLLALLGIAFVVAGAGIIFFPDILYPYLLGIFVILLGAGFIVMASRTLRRGDQDLPRNRAQCE